MIHIYYEGKLRVVKKTSMLRGKLVTIIGLLSDTHLYYEGKCDNRVIK